MTQSMTNPLIKKVDHTLLAPGARESQIRTLCEEAKRFGFASVCIPPRFVKFAYGILKEDIPVCTVVGFPPGYMSPDVKRYETEKALDDGAREIDMVIQIGALIDGNEAYVRREIELLKKACHDKILKVIIEACLLSDEQKLIACRVVTDAGADFIKTSTGFSIGGATVHDVQLLREHVGANVKVKAAGGIRTLADAEAMANAGADRLGMSSAIKAFGLE